TDHDLIAALNAGDAAAFDALYYRYRDRILRLAYRFTATHADAQDVLQETFSYLFRKFPGFRLTASMTTFLYPVVKNLSIDARRQRMRQTHGAEAAFDAIASPEEQASDTRSELSAVLSALPEGQR